MDNNDSNHGSSNDQQETVSDTQVDTETTIPQPTPPPPPPPQPTTTTTTTTTTTQQPQQTIIHVRDRLFHALFYRIAIMYARKFNKKLRRLIEFTVLLLALASFGLLTYLHVVFNRNPINCLSSIEVIVVCCFFSIKNL
jgi:hypothetical protein